VWPTPIALVVTFVIVIVLVSWFAIFDTRIVVVSSGTPGSCGVISRRAQQAKRPQG